MMNKKRLLAGLLVAVLTVASLSGCGEKKNENAEGVGEVSWYLSGVKLDSSYDDVWNRMNELLGERYGLKLNINLIDGSNFSQKVQMMNASQEAYDLAFTSNWTNNYHTNVANGSLLDLTDKLPEVTPKLWEMMSDAERRAVTVDGKIYAVPNWQVQARAMGFSFPKEKFELTGMSLDEINGFDDLEKYYEKLYSIEPELATGNGSNWQTAMTNYGMITVVQEGLPGVIYYNKAGKPQIVNQFATPEFMEFCTMVRGWVKKGYLPDVKSNKSYVGTGVIKQMGGWNNWKPGIGREEARRVNYDVVDKQISPAVLATETLLSTMTGVGANSKNPDNALKILEIMRTDKEIYNMLSWGLEGVNYEKTGENTIKVKDESTYSMANWAVGSVENSYILDGNPESIWEETRKFNDSAIVSPLIGFTFNNESIMAELGNCETVIKEYIDVLQHGQVDPETTIPEFLKELEIAGVDHVLQEVQKQIDAWWEGKN